MTVCHGGTLAVGEFLVTPRFACESARVWLRGFETNGLGPRLLVRSGPSYVGRISDLDSTFGYAP